MKNWQKCFREELEPQDRMKVEPVKLRLKDEEDFKRLNKNIRSPVFYIYFSDRAQ